MTEANYSHVTLVIDRSGSMQGLCEEAQAGVNTLLRDQFALPGKLTVTLVQFDDRIDTVTRMSSDAFGYELEPRGMTKLLDAVGGEIGRTGKDLAALDEADRPGRVLFVVVTDGQENSSQKFTLEQVRKLVKKQQAKFNWQFQFLGTGEAAWQGADMGMKATRSVNTPRGESLKYSHLNDAMTNYRTNAILGAPFVMPEEIEAAG